MTTQATAGYVGDAQAGLRQLMIDAGIAIPTSAMTVTKLSGGHSHVTWLVSQRRVGQDGPAEQFVVKVAERDGPLAPYDIQHEVAFTNLARRSGLPSPKIVYASDENAMGSPLFIMEFIEGDAPTPRDIVPWLVDHPDTSPNQLARETVRTLLAMGQVWTSDLAESMTDRYREYVDDAYESVHEAVSGVAEFPASVALAHEQLRDSVDLLGAATPSLVQGDFRFGNLLLTGGRIVAILDWERAMWGHPLHDLAYLTLPSMRYAGKIAGLIDDAELDVIWAEETGSSLDRSVVSYLRTLSIYTELCSCFRALCALARGRGRLSLLKILPIIARHEVDVLDALGSWDK